jgi:methionine-rich copper-binding protein CopC
LAVAIIGAVTLVPTRTAFAHAELLASDPPAGAQVAVAPAAVTLRFNESVTFVDESIRLIDATGAPVAGVGVPVHSEGGASASAALPALPDGGYVVAWTIVSADGHPASGAFTFVVGSGTAPDASIVAPEWFVAMLQEYPVPLPLVAANGTQDFAQAFDIVISSL